ncbi:MAG: GGDEF domain-containing protein [Phycisphaerae bacterium]
MEAIWEICNSSVKTAIFSVAAPEMLIRAIETVRELNSNVKLVVVVPPPDEPHGLRAVQRGADEYLLEPVTSKDLYAILSPADKSNFNSSKKRSDVEFSSLPTTVADVSRFDELAQVARILESLNDEPEQTLSQLAELLRSVFRATSAVIQWDGRRGVRGDASAAMVQEPLRRDGKIVGEIALGPPALGTYGQDTLKRLPEMARLVELILNVAGKVDHLAELACTDPLSGLNNRRHFDERFAALLEEAAARRAQLTLFLFDIDEFKIYNDKHGHHVGDDLIREVAKLLTASSRESDIVARYGGDEFAVIFWEHEEPRVAGSRHPSQTEVLAQRFCKVIHEHKFAFLGPAAPGPVTISGGLASFPWDGRTVDELIRAADDALLQAKKNGKNRIQIAGGKACGIDEDSEDMQ